MTLLVRKMVLWPPEPVKMLLDELTSNLAISVFNVKITTPLP